MANVTSKAQANDETNESLWSLRYIQFAFECVSNNYIHSISDSVDDTVTHLEDIAEKLCQFIVFTLFTLFAIIQMSVWQFTLWCIELINDSLTDFGIFFGINHSLYYLE